MVSIVKTLWNRYSGQPRYSDIAGDTVIWEASLAASHTISGKVLQLWNNGSYYHQTTVPCELYCCWKSTNLVLPVSSFCPNLSRVRDLLAEDFFFFNASCCRKPSCSLRVVALQRPPAAPTFLAAQERQMRCVSFPSSRSYTSTQLP